MGNKEHNAIQVVARRAHRKASEEYVDVIFRYGKLNFDWAIPIQNRRIGVDLTQATDEIIFDYLKQIYKVCRPSEWDKFRDDQGKFWDSKPNASVTKAFFDIMAADFRWKSTSHDLPANPNPARRIQDLKDFGYTIATATGMKHGTSGETATHYLLLPLPKGGVSGYETWSPGLRDRIIKVLGATDAYEGPSANANGLLPDHKFPEIRWDDKVKRENLESLSDEEIRRDFQLINNQRNQQKREACRRCSQTGERPGLFGIEFFSAGSKSWPDDVPIRGKAAEIGCKGCGWYDISGWRKALNSRLAEEE